MTLPANRGGRSGGGRCRRLGLTRLGDIGPTNLAGVLTCKGKTLIELSKSFRRPHRDHQTTGLPHRLGKTTRWKPCGNRFPGDRADEPARAESRRFATSGLNRPMANDMLIHNRLTTGLLLVVSFLCQPEKNP